jgi:hypothetical protein
MTASTTHDLEVDGLSRVFEALSDELKEDPDSAVVLVVPSDIGGKYTKNQPIRGAQAAFVLFSTFLGLRPVSTANAAQTSINSRLEIRISK